MLYFLSISCFSSQTNEVHVKIILAEKKNKVVILSNHKLDKQTIDFMYKSLLYNLQANTCNET